MIRPSKHVRELRQFFKEFNGLHQDLKKLGITPIDEQHFAYVRCKDCNTPAVLVRDVKAGCYAAVCERCATVSYLETIEEERSKPGLI